MNDYLTYVHSLAKLNSAHITPGVMPKASVFNAFAWGFVEEIEEYAQASVEQKINEAGDVLAYTTLLLFCVEHEPEDENAPKPDSITEISDLLSWWSTGHFNKLDYYSNLKRVNREGTMFWWANVLLGWTDVLRDAQKVHSLTFAEIAQTNIAKLQDRAERKVLFAGSGDDR